MEEIVKPKNQRRQWTAAERAAFDLLDALCWRCEGGINGIHVAGGRLIYKLRPGMVVPESLKLRLEANKVALVRVLGSPGA